MSDEFEARNLTFSLSVGPGRSDCRPNRGFILGDAAGERSHETSAGSFDPWVSPASALRRVIEWNSEIIPRASTRYASFDRRDRDRLCLRERVPSDRIRYDWVQGINELGDIGQ